MRRILELEHQVDALRERNDLAAELEATRESLRGALREAGHLRRGESPTGPPSRVPMLRQPDPSGQVVVWRRGR